MRSNIELAKSLGIQHNVCIRVIDEPTNRVIVEHAGHNAATNTLLNGIGQFLLGGAVTGAGTLLDMWIPQYISLGTMGLRNQEEDSNGLPAGVGDLDDPSATEEEQMTDYLKKTPGFGSDGYDKSLMNGRKYTGLGRVFADRPSIDTTGATVECELISNTFPRSPISYRQCLPESRSEYPETIDVVFSALISTGALAQFREPDKDYIFITEVGLWSSPIWPTIKKDGQTIIDYDSSNGLLAGYRICPNDKENWDMSIEANRTALKKNIIRVGINQVVQVIWKIQLGAIDQLGNLNIDHMQ